MKSHILSAIMFFGALALICLCNPVSAEVNRAFPPDPAGIAVIDRECHYYGGLNALYAIMYNKGNCGYVDIFTCRNSTKSENWKKIYTWKIVFQGTPVIIRKPSLLSINESDDKVYISLLDGLKYYEGKVTIYLIYDPAGGTFTQSFSD